MKYSNNQHLSGSYHQAAKGMYPREHVIAPGTKLYRFIDLSRSPSIVGADGPWWFEYESFQTIKHWSLQHGYNLSYSARLFAAILYEWSMVNAFVIGEVKQPIKVWKGKGKQIIEEDKQGNVIEKMTPVQGLNEVYQIYVPGLGYPYHQFSTLFKFIGSQQIKVGHPFY